MYETGANRRHLIPATRAGINNTVFQLASLSEGCVIRGILPEQGRKTLRWLSLLPCCCHSVLQPAWLPTLHLMAECVLTFHCWATEPAHVQQNWPLFSGAHWKGLCCWEYPKDVGTMLPASILCPPDGSAQCVSVWLRDTKWAKRISSKQRKLVTVVQKPAGTSQTQPNQLHFH